MHLCPNYYKKIHPSNVRRKFVLLGITMINLSLDELRLIAQVRNISDYENKSREDLIKALSEPKPETKSKLIPKLKSEKKTKTKTKTRNKNKTTTRNKTKTNTKTRTRTKTKTRIKTRTKIRNKS